jgi:lipid A 4'-phosphatase
MFASISHRPHGHETGLDRMPILFIFLTTAVAVVFVVFPRVDLWFSGLFWNPETGFFLGETWYVSLLYELVPVIVIGTALLLLVLFIRNLIRKDALGPFSNRALLFVLLAFVVGPGLVVNVVFKDQWGRARPRDVVEFGGERQFTPAVVISDQCERNCSFTAGHPSAVFALVAFAFLATRRRKAAIAAAIMAGSLVGLGRILQGGHFLSDVIFSGVFVVAIAWLLYYKVLHLDRERARPAAASPGVAGR